MTADMGKSLGRLDVETQKAKARDAGKVETEVKTEVQQALNQQAFLKNLEGLSSSQGKEILSITGNLDMKEKQSFIETFNNLPEARRKEGLAFMEQKDGYFQKLDGDKDPYGTSEKDRAKAKGDAFLLATNLPGKTAAEKTSLIEATQIQLGKSDSLDRKNMTKLLTEVPVRGEKETQESYDGRCTRSTHTAGEVMQFFKDEKTIGKIPLTTVPKQNENESAEAFYNRCKKPNEKKEDFDTRVTNAPQERRNEILYEAYARARMGNAEKIDGSGKPVALTEGATDRMTAELVNVARAGKGSMSSEMQLVQMREIDKVKFATGDPNYNGPTHTLTLPSEMLGKDYKMSSKDGAMLIHEFAHVNYQAAIDIDRSGNKDSIAFTSKVVEQYDKISSSPEAQQKFLDAMGKRYKELGYDDKAIASMKASAYDKNGKFMDADEFMAHAATITLSTDSKGKSLKDLTDANGKNYVLDSMPPGTGKLIADHMTGKVPTDQTMITSKTGEVLDQQTKAFFENAAETRKYLDDPAHKAEKEKFIEAARAQYKNIYPGETSEQIAARVNGMFSNPADDKNGDKFAAALGELSFKRPGDGKETEKKDTSLFSSFTSKLGSLFCKDSSNKGKAGIESDFAKALPPGMADRMTTFSQTINKDDKTSDTAYESVKYVTRHRKEIDDGKKTAEGVQAS